MPHYPYLYALYTAENAALNSSFLLFLRGNDFDDATSVNDQTSLLLMYL
jgi:hypothetical protein